MVNEIDEGRFFGDKSRIEGVYALIGGMHGVYLLENTEVTRILCFDEKRIYGITRKDEYYYAVSPDYGEIWRFKIEGSTVTDVDVVCRMVWPSNASTPFGEVRVPDGFHQIDFIDDTLWVSDVRRNCFVGYVIIEDGNLQPGYELHPYGVVEYNVIENIRNKNCYGHFNSIYATADNIYIVAHNDSMNKHRDSLLLMFGLNFTDFIKSIPVGRCAHNVITNKNGDLFVCDSLHGSVINAITNEIVFKASDDYFLRGLAMNDDFVLVGGTKIVNKKAGRLATKDDISFIYYLDTEFNYLGKKELLTVSRVYEIRYLEFDYGYSNTWERS